MYHILGFSKQNCRLLAVLCGKVADRQSNGVEHLQAYPPPKTVSYGHLEIQTLINPTLDTFRDAQKSFDPTFLCFQGEQLEDKEEIGSLVWGTLDVSDPQMLSSLIGPSLPTTIRGISEVTLLEDLEYTHLNNLRESWHHVIQKFVMLENETKSTVVTQEASHPVYVLFNRGDRTKYMVYLEVPNSENIAQALRSKGVPYVIYWKDSFSFNGACHFRQALLSVLQSSCSHSWDAFQLAHASFRLYWVRNDHVLPVNGQNISGILGPCLLGNTPKIEITSPEKTSGEVEKLSDALATVTIHDDDVVVRFLVCRVPHTLDAYLLGSLEDGLSALLNIEIRGSKLHYRVSATPPLQDAAYSQGVVTMRCDLITDNAACVSVLVSGSAQTFSDYQLLDHIKCKLIEKSHLAHALLSREESEPPLLEPLNSVSLACGASLFEVCMKVPNWAAQVLKHLARSESYRNFVILGIVSIEGIPVCSFDKDDEKRLFSFCTRRGQDSCDQDGFLFALPIWSSPVSRKRSRPYPEMELRNYSSNMVAENGAAQLRYDQTVKKEEKLREGSRMSFVSVRQKLKAAAMRPIPHSRQHRMLGSRSKPNMPIRAPAKLNLVPPTPATRRKSTPSSSRALQIVPFNPPPTMKHGCNRSSIKVCSEEEFLKDVMQFLILKGHSRLVPQGRVSEFPDAILDGKRLDLYNLYREVVSRGGFHVGNGINWKGQVFSKMRNHTVTKRMNGVTHALKKHYETYLLEYEAAHDDLGGDRCLLCHSSTPGDWVNCALCGEWAHFGCERRQGIGHFKDYAKSDGVEYICPHCSLTSSKRKS